MREPVALDAHLKDPDGLFNIKECVLCGGFDREDFIMRRVHEQDFGCRHCRSPGLGIYGFRDPSPRKNDKIGRLIRAGYFNRYEVFA